MKAMPPEFCWKSGADAGRIPTDCPDGWERKLALCYEKCKSGYKHVLGVCWKFPKSYIPKSITNF